MMLLTFIQKLIDAHPECQIILYNFEKLSGYKFSEECVKELVRHFLNK